ncbi:hypothetical protein D3C72_2010460 [compost metagenome]
MAEGLGRRAAEIGGRLDQVGRHALEGCLDRQDHEGQPDVDEDDEGAGIADRERVAADDGERQPGIEQPQQMQLSQEPGDDAFLGQNQLPRIDLDEIARPERQHDAEIEQHLPFSLRVARGVIGDREGDERRGERHDCRH